MRFRVPSLFLSLYLGYNNLDNLYMRYIHRILAILFCLFFSTVSAQKVGLVLSGGGAKGLTHIGIIRALEENNIPIDYITGTSMGAIVGSLYAMGYSPDDMESLSNRKISNDGTPEGYRKNTSIISNGIHPHRNLSISACH